MWFWLVMLGWIALIAAFALNRRLSLSTPARYATYLLGIPAVAYVGAVAAGIGETCPAEASDCDLTGVAGIFVGAAVIIVGFGSAIVFEGIRAFLRAADRYEQR